MAFWHVLVSARRSRADLFIQAHARSSKESKTAETNAKRKGRSPLNRLAIRSYTPCGRLCDLTPFLYAVGTCMCQRFFLIHCRCTSYYKMPQKRKNLIRTKQFVLGFYWWKIVYLNRTANITYIASTNRAN